MIESVGICEEKSKVDLIPVYHATRPELLPSILNRGLLPMHDIALTVFPGDIDAKADFKEDIKHLNGLFDEVSRWIKPSFQRAGSIFARLTPEETCTGNDSVIKIMINPDKVLVADQNNFDIAMKQYRYGLMDGVYFRAQKYWSTAVTLIDFRLRNPDFDFPEVLIPDSVTKEQIAVYAK